MTHRSIPSILGSLVIVGSFAGSGCFLQTKVVYPSSVNGYYTTEPGSVSYTAALSSGTINVAGSTNAVPAYTASVLTAPFEIQLPEAGATSGGLFPTPTNADPSPSGQPITFDPTNHTFSITTAITNGAASAITDAWGTDSGCELETTFTVSGALTPLGTTSSTANVDGTSVTVLGRFQGSVTVSLLIADTTNTSVCASALADISTCYSSMSNCDATVQEGYQSIFGPWISDASVITAAEIGSLVPNVAAGSLSYTVQYQ